MFVSEKAFEPPVIEDLGFGNGAIVEAGFEGVFNDHAYRIVDGRISWQEAKEKCEAEGGHLVTITTQEEQQFIDILNSRKRVLWIGLYREMNSDEWNWITGEGNEYINWLDGEPSNGEETAASVRPDRWNDLREGSTGEIEGYICEWDHNIWE